MLRRQRADIEYVRELARFVEGRMSADELARARTAAAGSSEAMPQGLSALGQTWVAHQRRIATLEADLARLLALDSRVAGLYAKLDQRRDEAQGLLPEKSEPKARCSTPEVEEVGVLLAGLHERLFKALYALSPALVEPGAATVPH
jgi:hypothetical protein